MRNVTFKQLRAFAGVVRTGSVTGAAQSLNVSPPAITLQMQLLQDHAGLPLIERSPAGMVPTEAGREVMGAVERIEAILAECDAALGALSGSEIGTVSVGIVSTAKYFAPRALVAFARTHPGIALRLTIGNRTEIIAGLSHFEIDIAIMGRPPDETGFAATVIGDHPHGIIAPPDHPLARIRKLDPHALAGETFLVREPGSGTRSLMERFFAEVGITPQIGMQIASNETIKQGVIAGLGLSFISEHTVEAELADGRLVALDVAGLPIVRQWHVVRLRERRLMPGVDVLRRFLSEEGNTFLPCFDSLMPPAPSPGRKRNGGGPSG